SCEPRDQTYKCAPCHPPPAGPPNPRGAGYEALFVEVWLVSNDNCMRGVLCLMLRPPIPAVRRWIPERPCACAQGGADDRGKSAGGGDLQPLERRQPGLSPPG